MIEGGQVHFCNLSDITPISVETLNDQSYVWKAKDVLQLRRLHLVGSLVGSLPRKPWQNIAHSLPLLLLKEEVMILKQLNKLSVTGSQAHFAIPSLDQSKQLRKYHDELHLEQIKAFAETRNKKCECYSSTIRQGEKGIDTGTGDDRNTDHDTGNEGSEQDLLELQASGDCSKFKDKVNDSTSCLKGRQRKQVEGTDVSEEDKKYYDGATWTLIPHTYDLGNCTETDWPIEDLPEQSIRFSVFSDLWRRGYYITTAEKFGADYLVYPDDPMRFHSFYIVKIVYNNKVFEMSNLIAFARLGTSVNKTILFATADPKDMSKVTYNSLAWAGIS